MDIYEKLDLVMSAQVVAEFFGVWVGDLVWFTATFQKPEKLKEWNEIAKEVEEFSKNFKTKPDGR